jgi:hypothetical protein
MNDWPGIGVILRCASLGNIPIRETVGNARFPATLPHIKSGDMSNCVPTSPVSFGFTRRGHIIRSVSRRCVNSRRLRWPNALTWQKNFKLHD